MAQQFLDRAQVGPALQQMRGKAVAERVCSQPFSRRQLHAGFFDQPLDVASVQAAAAQADENRNVSVVFGLAQTHPIAFGKIFSQSAPGKFSERNNTLFPAFAEDANELLRHVDIFIIQADKFANPKPARIKQFENGTITQILHRSSMRYFDDSRRFFLAEIGRQLLRQPRR